MKNWMLVDETANEKGTLSLYIREIETGFEYRWSNVFGDAKIVGCTNSTTVYQTIVNARDHLQTEMQYGRV